MSEENVEEEDLGTVDEENTEEKSEEQEVEPSVVTIGNVDDEPEPETDPELPPELIPEPDTTPMPEIVSDGTEIAEKPCDPTKMNCDELGNHIMGLVDKRSEYTQTINKLDDVKKVMPSENIDKIYEDAIKEKQAIDDEIYLVAEKAIACRTLTPEKEE